MSLGTERLKAFGLRAAVALATVGALYFLATSTAAQTAVILFGVSAGTSKPLSVDASGNLNIKCLSGCIGAAAGPSGSVQYNSAGTQAGSALFSLVTPGAASMSVTVKGGTSQSTTPEFQVLRSDSKNLFRVDETNNALTGGASGAPAGFWLYGVNGVPAVTLNYIPSAAGNISLSKDALVAWTASVDASNGPFEAAISRPSTGNMLFQDGSGTPITVNALQYNTSGNPIQRNVGSAALTGLTSANTNFINVTPPLTAQRYQLVGIVNVSAWTTPASFTVSCTYKDEGGTSRTETLAVQRGSNGTIAAAITAIDRWRFALTMFGTDATGGAITCSTSGTFTGSPTYSIYATLYRVQ